MKKLFCLYFAFLAAVTHCLAQDIYEGRNPMKYALIDGRQAAFGNSGARLSGVKIDHTRYIDYVVTSYIILLHLDKGQSTVLRTVLFTQCSASSVTPEDIHLVLQRKMPRILGHVHYVQWLSLREYPELNHSFLF